MVATRISKKSKAGGPLKPMIMEIIIALCLGLIAGTITGLIPGIHINLIAALILSLITTLSGLPTIAIATFIASMAITHTFLDFIPSIFFGAPEEDTFLSILPGHQYLKEGKAYEAVILTLYGSLMALATIVIFAPVFIFIIPVIFSYVKLIFPFILIFLSLYLIFREKNFLLSLTIFIFSGFLGIASFNLPIQNPLLPLLSGLFGASALIITIKQKTSIPKQTIYPIKQIKTTKQEFLKAISGAIISAPICSFLPGIGAGHAAVIGSEFIQQSKRGFLILLGAINTIVMGLSFITIFSIGRTRTGAALAIKSVLETVTLQDISILIVTIVVSGIVSFLIALNISKIFSKYISKIDYSYLSISILIVLSVIILAFSNALGFLTFITASALGVFTILSGARRINLMGVLLIPTITFYLLSSI